MSREASPRAGERFMPINVEDAGARRKPPPGRGDLRLSGRAPLLFLDPGGAQAGQPMTITSATGSSDPPRALPVVVMGVAGAGKTTVGLRLAEALHGQFIDGDDLHTDEARAKMSQGLALTDEDRWPWFDRIAEAIRTGMNRGETTIVASSALKRVYRDRLRQLAGAGLRFVYLSADRDLMRARVGGRHGHYMPASLVDSQFGTLEPPDGEPDVIAMAADADLNAAIPKLAAELFAGIAPT